MKNTFFDRSAIPLRLSKPRASSSDYTARRCLLGTSRTPARTRFHGNEAVRSTASIEIASRSLNSVTYGTSTGGIRIRTGRKRRLPSLESSSTGLSEAKPSPISHGSTRTRRLECAEVIWGGFRAAGWRGASTPSFSHWARGELSDPVPAPGGVTLFFVSDTRAERTYSYEDVRSRIESWLRTAQRAERLDDRVAGLDPPAGSIVLDHDDLLAKFEAHNSEATVLSIGDFSVTLVELGRLLEDTKTATPPWGSRADRISSLYRQLVRHQLLYLELCSTARSTIGVGSTSTGLPSLRSTRGFK